MTDVIVVGGGVIGLSIADELAGQGAAVTLLEHGEFGREASWAGAGILPPGNRRLATSPKARLRAVSHALWPELSRRLLEQTGIDNGFRECGGIAVRLNGGPDELQHEISCWRNEGVEVQELPVDELQRCEPELSDQVSSGYRLPELRQVRNPRHSKALVASCAARGVRLRPGTPVVGIERDEERIVSVRSPDETWHASMYCIAGGAWSQQLVNHVGANVGVGPVRGQIVLLGMQPLPIRHVVEVGKRYLVPRPDGRILVGSTEERVGFKKRNTATAVSELIRFAEELVPSLSAATFERAWSGLRPGSIDELPYLGRVAGFENLFLAAGHFRSGLQMSPATAVVMRQVMLEQPPSIPWEAFRCDRHQDSAASAKADR